MLFLSLEIKWIMANCAFKSTMEDLFCKSKSPFYLIEVLHASNWIEFEVQFSQSPLRVSFELKFSHSHTHTQTRTFSHPLRDIVCLCKWIACFLCMCVCLCIYVSLCVFQLHLNWIWGKILCRLYHLIVVQDVSQDWAFEKETKRKRESVCGVYTRYREKHSLYITVHSK